MPTAALVAGLAAAGLGVVAPQPCDAETTYHCAQVRADPEREGGRTLVLDSLRHSYVDVDDPTFLEFDYVKALAGVTAAAYDAGEPLRAYHLGGGGLTFPRYLAATRPGTQSLVSEIDPGVVRVDEERLGLETGPDLQVRVEDGRLGVRRLDDDSRDLVVGDAFGGVSVPWHLTTREAVGDIARVLDDDGVYAVNLIDYPPLGFARAEVATLRATFDHVLVASDAATLAGDEGGNLVAVASDRALDPDAVVAGFGEQDLAWEVLEGDTLDAWVGDARVLTDDFAPVDQLLTPTPS